MPCRGSGKVISKLGDSVSDVTCPWCEGSGVRTPGIDAQARWNARAGDGAPADGAAADASAPAGSAVGTADERSEAGAGGTADERSEAGAGGDGAAADGS
jgi:hypothetical protein